MKEAIRIAQELERAEEEEMMRRAIEESERLDQSIKKELVDEEEMIRQAILLSEQEEQSRIQRQKTQEMEEMAKVT